ncbi:MAG: CheR family methyltransferase [Steroidobacteraceae bacterium]
MLDGSGVPPALSPIMNDTVDYGQYRAQHGSGERGLLYRAARAAWHAQQRFLFDVLLYPYGQLRHRALQASARRSQSHTYTSFNRVPAQLAAFTGPVLDFLLAGREGNAPLVIDLFAGSNGAEAYTLASVLRSARPGLAFHIHASDLHPEMVAKARAARYTRDEVLHSESITPEFIAATFDADGQDFIVKPELRAQVSFVQADLLDAGIDRQYGPADVVIVQNVLFHLDPRQARFAFGNVVRFLKPRAALLVDGVDLDLKVELTRAAGLAPLEWRYREIYDYGRRHIALAWWRHYYGAEPRSFLKRDPVRRYGTIFLRG